MGLIAVSAETGSEVPISSQRWEYIFDVAWLGDGSGLLISAWEKGTSIQQIWRVSYPGGEAHRVTNDLNQYSRLSITADSSALVTVQSQAISNIWVMPNGNESLARQITSGGDADSAAWTPDGKIVYRSAASGNVNIWMMEADGTHQKQLTFFDTSYPPIVTPDGRFIIYTFTRDGVQHIGRSDIDGGNQRQVSNRPTGTYDFPACSPDGKWILYAINLGRQNLWKVSVDGGEPVQITDADFVRSPAVSPDGKLIACYYSGKDESVLKLALIPFEGGQPIKLLDIPAPTVSAFQLPLPRWTPDGRAVTYIATREGVSNIWAQPIDGGAPKQLTNFKSDQIFFFDWTRDGRQLALARGTVSNDVVQISNFK
jgi:Tol biopolymer transport system component